MAISPASEERITKIERMLEGLVTTVKANNTDVSDIRTQAIYAEIDLILHSMSVKRERGRSVSQAIVNNLARFDVLMGGRI